VARRITSQSLGLVNKALGLAGTSGPGDTELMDGTVEQVLDVGPIVRRSRTPAGTGGIFRVTLRNLHSGATTVSNSWQPYESALTGLVAPYQSPMPDTFDVWLLGASLSIASGVGNISNSVLLLTNVQLGFAADSAAAAITPTTTFTLAFWNFIIETGTQSFGVTQSAAPYKPFSMRIPRKGAIASPFLVFESVSAGDVEADIMLLMGVFPVALGQDVIG